MRFGRIQFPFYLLSLTQFIYVGKKELGERWIEVRRRRNDGFYFILLTSSSRTYSRWYGGKGKVVHWRILDSSAECKTALIIVLNMYIN